MRSSTVDVVPSGGEAAVASSPQPHPRPRPKKNLAPFWLLTPAALVLLTLTIAPILLLVGLSFTDYDQKSLFTGAFAGVGVSQYASIFTDPEFLWSLVRTVLFATALVAGSLVIGMGVSQLLTRVGRTMRYVVTVVLIFAWAVPNVASSLVWVWLFQPGYGVVNWLLTQARVFGDMTDVNWAESPALAYTAIWLLIVWQAVPFIALTLNAAQTQVPAEYFEAARLDGANEWRIYRMITLHFLKPTLLLVAILSVIWDFNVFNQIWLVSQGGPGNATSTLGIWTYKTAFVGFHLGEGAAIAVVTTAMLMALTAYYIRNLLRSGEEL
ncbi:carbohydrate ABC transporter permease [Pengzhenrongella frigida]|uniref:Sugar ABC transporter permease n=1 Tax=Pengzhenrongella frigida TaxID=1259133 RepID=A0A4Q5N1A3_9MICO|nr:sugar ABC transporter permease [Cellulomonas sp. HLT2-17]RYV49801.1 sugar ABC transporter permease [Cellulomonas sp. HLT2-17]